MADRYEIVVLKVRLRVKSTKRLIAYSKAQALRKHGDPEWAPEDIADAVKNALVVMPQPALKELGLELVEVAADVEGDP